MNKTFQLACAGSVLLLGIGKIQAFTATFDDLGLNPLDAITTQYAADGITFAGITDGGQSVSVDVSGNTVFGDNNPPSPPLSLSNFYDNSGGNRAHITELLFSGPASGISFQFDGAGSSGNDTVFNVYDTSFHLIDSFSDPNATDSNYHLETVSDVNVGEIDVVNPSSGWGLYLDDIAFSESGSTVPDAASTGLLLTGAFGVLAAMRRKMG